MGGPSITPKDPSLEINLNSIIAFIVGVVASIVVVTAVFYKIIQAKTEVEKASLLISEIKKQVASSLRFQNYVLFV